MKKDISQIDGLWDSGYTLDRQVESSTFLGDDENGKPQFDTKRTEVGEAMYQLKYKGDFSKIDPLSNELVSLIKTKFKSIDVVIPMPPSKQRGQQPVIELAKAVAAKLGKKYSDTTLVKNGITVQMKDLKTREERVSALLGCFIVNKDLGAGPIDILIMDDIFATGSSLEAASQVLRQYPTVRHIYVAVLTRTKS